ncbi:MAG: carbohydrate-binding family 9-like protein [Verrucomicrobiia bacterium]
MMCPSRYVQTDSHRKSSALLWRNLSGTSWLLFLALLIRGTLQAEADGPTLADPLPRLKVPYTKVVPAMNAEPGEAVWQKAAVIPRLTLSKDGPEGVKPLPTEVRLLWTEDHLFVRFQSVTKAILVPHGAARDADHHQGDVVEIFLDPVGDGRQVCEIQVNPRGGILDVLWLATADPKSDEAGVLTEEFHQRDWWIFRHWNIVGLRVANHLAHQKEGGIAWTCDIAIPGEALFRRLGRRTFENQELRANFLRYDGQEDVLTGRRKEEIFMNWSTVRHGCPHISPSRLGILDLSGRPANPEEAKTGDKTAVAAPPVPATSAGE